MAGYARPSIKAEVDPLLIHDGPTLGPRLVSVSPPFTSAAE